MKSAAKLTIYTFLLFSFFACLGQNSKFTISGYVKEKGSQELLPGVTIYVPSINSGVVTNNYGFYSLTLPEGSYDLIYSFVGFEGSKVSVELNEDVVINQFLSTATLALDEVVINAELQVKESEITQMSLLRLPTESVQQIPAFMGEKDVLKVLQLMPGVQSGSEGNSGLYVRGGGPDQNLIILDDAIVYNANHLFGFFSIFNGDAIKSIELYKGGFPARFGGRLSSVIKLDLKDGNKEEKHGKIGVGLVSSSFLLEGPLKKGKSSYLISARRTYIDALIAPLNNTDTKGGYFFYDFNAKINHEYSSTDKLYISAYFGKDKFFSKDKTINLNARLGWGNASSTVRWNHQFSKKFFANTSLIFSRYLFKITEESGGFDLKYNTSIRDFGIKYDVDFFPNLNHSIKFGVASTSHRFVPNALVEQETGLATFNPDFVEVDTENKFATLESAFYLEDEMHLLNRLNVNAGFRFSHFIHKSKQYYRPEPRIAMAYKIFDNFSIKSSYASMNQYVHLLSNSGVGLPTDLWVSSTDRVKPQSSDQVAVGLAKDLPRNVSITFEGYLKRSKNVIAYKDGASFLILDDPGSAESISWEDNITTGSSESYGIELLIQRKVGEFNGWIGYTLSKTEVQFDEINLGEKFLSKYDRRHDVSVVGIYNISDRITLSGTWVYGTGNNYSLPVRIFRTAPDDARTSFFFNNTFEDIERRNNFQAEAYHRIDFSFRMSKQKKKGVRTWDLSIYNAYSRKNPFFYTRAEKIENGRTTGVLEKLSIFPILPSISYTYEF
ncbi:MAG: TonB-dependent receptor [Cyclobacteriaceae bacterium]